MDGIDRAAAVRAIAYVCAAQVLVQIGAFFWPALLPELMARWSLTNSEAGWITAVFYAAYIVAVPVLVTLTDRIDAKRVYLCGVGLTVAGHALFAAFADGFWSAFAARALTGVGWAGTYMTGLKLLADKVDGPLLSRAAAGHAASIGISGALSFACADLLANLGGWRLAFIAAAVSACCAWALVALAIPAHAGPAPSKPDGAMFDFRPVLRNRSAMAYAIAYCIHTFEMSALRGWGVAFLGFVAVTTGTAGSGLLSPALTLTLFGLLGTLASVLGNEAAILFGRRRLIAIAMIGSAVCAVLLGVAGPHAYVLAAVLILIYGPLIWLDSSSLTAGTAGTADPARRGATLAVHSMLGYLGGFVGPLAVGWTLDFRGANAAGWATAFSGIAALSALALIVFLMMRPRALEGDRA